MIIPVRCFTCGKVLADKWEYYNHQVEMMEKGLLDDEKHSDKQDKDKNPEKHENNKDIPKSRTFEKMKTGHILDKLGLKRMCCRRHFIGHIDLMEII